MTSPAFAKLLIKMRDEGALKFDQLILEFPERGTAHGYTSVSDATARNATKTTATKKNGKTVYLPGLHP